jgi:hypothetical protein
LLLAVICGVTVAFPIVSVPVIEALSVLFPELVAVTVNVVAPGCAAAVVVTVNVDACDVSLLVGNEREAGLNEKLVPAGSPVMLKFAVNAPLLPLVTVTV